MKHTHIRNAALLGLTLLSGAAHAHIGHGTSSLMEGLAHPFGLDHLLAMVAVGIWSVKALPTGKAGWGPATFLLALLASAALGAAGIVAPYLEHAISLSVVLFGLMLVFAHRALPTAVVLSLIAVTSALHGLAHGAETPATGFVGYAIGFMLTTAVLHLSGLGVGLAIQRWMGQRSGLALGGLGVAMGAVGLDLFTQLA